MWALLANMPNLRYLKIAVFAYEYPRPLPAQLQETWLSPLEQLRGRNMDTFELQVPESYARHFNVGEAANFKLNTFPDVIL